MNEPTTEGLFSIIQAKLFEYLEEGVPVRFEEDGEVVIRRPISARDLVAASKTILDMQLRVDQLQREARKVSSDTVIPFPATPSIQKVI